MATSTTSAVSVSSAPPSTFLTRTATPSSVTVAPSVRVLVRTPILRRCSDRASVVLTSSSSRGKTPGNISTSVTCAP